MIEFGIDRKEALKKIKDKNVCLLCNIASVDFKLKHIIDVLKELKFNVLSILAPQHGFLMDKQDNMKESSDITYNNIPVYSLYGKTRIPEEHMFKGAKTLIFDLQDVGSRYYTYIYTMAYTMQICSKLGIEFIVLDRANPIGAKIEGGLINKGYESFVGLYPLPNRHGLTIAEFANYINFTYNINCKLKIIKIKNYKRAYDWTDTKRAWVLPSPNMPSYEAALNYTGLCLLEATNVSEGRGTTKPFELFGAPFIQEDNFLKNTVIKNLKGVYFRKHSFIPTFNKFKNELCYGFQVHVTNKKIFNSYKTGLAIIYAIYKMYGKEFKFIEPPYEYEFTKKPIDILTGSSYFRESLNKNISFNTIYTNLEKTNSTHKKNIKNYLLYK